MTPTIILRVLLALVFGTNLAYAMKDGHWFNWFVVGTMLMLQLEGME